MALMTLRVILGLSLGAVLIQSASAVPQRAEGACFRFHKQWKTTAHDKQIIHKKYGKACFVFDKHGTLILKGLPAPLAVRVRNLYNQCMKDGCVFCDAGEGSCERGNCGIKNCDCKPYMKNGRPVCGEECIYYALHQL